MESVGVSLPSSDSDTSLAYMARNSVLLDNTRNSALLGETRPLTMYRDEPPQLSSLSSGLSLDFERKGGMDGTEEPYRRGLPTVKSLHLLALPDMDLDFGVSFDGISGSPTTPRKARKSLAIATNDRSPLSSPQRSRTLRDSPASSPTQHRAAERRRSKSFDGASGSTILGDMWRSQGEEAYVPGNVAELFENPTSSSVPLLSKQLVDFSSSPDLVLSTSSTGSTVRERSQLTPAPGPSSAESAEMSHERTPSNASSMNESSISPSPSPPRTPPDIRHAFGPRPVYPVKTASTEVQEVRNEISVETAWSSLGAAPSVPLPALPALAPVVPTMTLAPPTAPALTSDTLGIPDIASDHLGSAAVITDALTTVLGPKSSGVTTCYPLPTARMRTLHSRSQRVVSESLTSTKQLAREIEILLQTFKYPSHTTTGAERAAMVRSELLNLIAEVDKRPVETRDESVNASLREAGFQWADALLFELKVDRAANERGACLEGLASILER
jgi:hypothetical protein